MSNDGETGGTSSKYRERKPLNTPGVEIDVIDENSKVSKSMLLKNKIYIKRKK
jgi:hypothetical protein